MTSSSHNHARAIQQDTRAWADFAGLKYTSALRQVQAPPLQGLLGERVSVRHLIHVLDEHPVIGAAHNRRTFGHNGLGAARRMANDLDDHTLRNLVLSIEFLRMFTPTATANVDDLPDDAWVSSYTLKHTAERFLGQAVDAYITNGVLIWAAAALDLPMAHTEERTPNILIAIPRQEHRYVQRMTLEGEIPEGDHYQPPGFGRLQAALDRIADDVPIGDLNDIAVPERRTSAFHDWLASQADSQFQSGLAAHDYVAGVEDGQHRAVESPEDYLLLMQEIPCSIDFYRAAEQLVHNWRELQSTTV